MAVQTRIQVRRGSLSQWNAAAATLGNGILYQGEIGYETDTGRFKVGDGSTAWGTLSYASVLPSNFVAGSGISLTPGTNGSTLTISLSDPTIQVADITDFAEGVDDRVNALLQAGTNISLSYNDEANTLTINSTLGTEEVQDAIGTYVSGVSGIAVSYNDTTGYTTISLSDPTIQASDVTDFSEAVNNLIDSAVSTSIVAGSGVDIVYNSGNNTLTVSSALTAGSGLSLSHSSGNYTISLSDPTIQLADVTDLSSDARNFLLTPSSNNLATLVTNETGSGNLVFSNSPTLVTPNIGVATGTSFNSITGLSSSTPLVDGTAAVGTSTAAARADHVHPTDTSRAAVAGTLGQFASTTSSQLAGVISDETGSGLLVFNNSPTLITPTLGVASATSLNKVNITAPATSATLTIADGKTLTASNSLTFTGTDSSSVAFGAGGTVVYTSNKLNALSSTTSAELRGVITNPTGSGSLVFSDNPTLNGAAVNGNLTVSGSGLVASNINNFDSQVRTSRLDQMSAPTSDVSLNSRKITNLADPTNNQDAATKAYVDAARSGLDVKQSVRVATTGNITIGSATTTIDNITLNNGDRVLVKNQNTASQNGIYVAGFASWARAEDANSDAEVTSGMFVFVEEGTTNADSGWVLTTDGTISVGTTALAFAQFSGAGQITAGNGLSKSGNTISAVGTAGRIVVGAGIDLDTVSRSNTAGTAGINFVQSVSTDNYGRVTASVAADVRDATTSDKGIASFDTGDFSVTSGAVSIKASGVGNSQLENSAVTIGSTSVSLGGTATTIAGLTSVSSTGFTGALTGNASTATTLQTSRTINGTSFNGSADITIAFVDGGTP